MSHEAVTRMAGAKGESEGRVAAAHPGKVGLKMGRLGQGRVAPTGHATL